MRQLTGRRERWKGSRDEAALYRGFGRRGSDHGVRWNGRQSAQWMHVHLPTNVLLSTPPDIEGNEKVSPDKRISVESLDTHISLEHVEEYDVHRRKARD